MKLNYLPILFFIAIFNNNAYAQNSTSTIASQVDSSFYYSYIDYIWTNDSAVGSDRKVQVSDYHSDTLKAYYSADWHTCLPGVAKYIAYAVKEGDFWHCTDYYTENGQELRGGFFEDQALTKPVGPFRYYYKNGRLAKRGAIKNHKRSGKWVCYFPDGRLAYTTVYKNNYKTGSSVFIKENNDSTLYVLDSLGQGYSYYHYANGIIHYHGKYAPYGIQDSLWVYYDKKGRIWYTEMYRKGKLEKETCYDTTGKLLEKCISKQPEFRRGKNSVGNYLYNHVSFPNGYKLTKGPMRLVATFVVEKDGTVGEIHILQHLHPAFDKKVIDALQHMPRWKSPGIDHNRIVKSYFTAPFTFKN